MRLPTDPRTDDTDVPLRMIWDGTIDAASKISMWARNSAYNARFQYALPEKGQLARTLVEHPFPDSDEWVPTPVGSVIERESRDRDAPLRVIPPEKDPASTMDAGLTLKEAA